MASLLRTRAAGDALWLDVTCDSMGAAIASGSRVHVVPDREPRRGQVWAFVDEDGRVVVHRFRRRTADGSSWFQGDANAGLDVAVDDGRLVGRVIAVDDGGRRRRLGPIATVRGRLWLDARSARSRTERAIWRRRDRQRDR